MRRVQRKETKGQQTPSVDEGVSEHTVSLSMIQALIPLGLRAVEERLQGGSNGFGWAALRTR